jgi:aryl-alcohol dehydrogenase-like predicted oxidoreductase
VKYGSVQGLGKDISKLVLGTASFDRMEQDVIEAVCDRFVELGGNAFDCAYIYGGGEGSKRLGQWLRKQPERDRFVILTKGCHPLPDGSHFSVDDLNKELEIELERLGIEYADIWVFHRDEPDVDLTPILRRLNELKREDKLHAFGGSNWQVERIEEANRIAAEHGWKGFSLNNPNLSLATVNEPMWAGCVTADEQMRDWHERTQFPLFSWSSTAGGYFADVQSSDVARVYENETNRQRKERVKELAEQKGCTPVQIALAWVLNQPFPVFALSSCETPEQVDQNAQAVELDMSAKERTYLEGA